MYSFLFCSSTRQMGIQVIMTSQTKRMSEPGKLTTRKRLDCFDWGSIARQRLLHLDQVHHWLRVSTLEHFMQPCFRPKCPNPPLLAPQLVSSLMQTLASIPVLKIIFLSQAASFMQIKTHSSSFSKTRISVNSNFTPCQRRPVQPNFILISR